MRNRTRSSTCSALVVTGCGCTVIGMLFADTLGVWKYIPLGLGILLNAIAVGLFVRLIIRSAAKNPKAFEQLDIPPSAN